jgi:hypothetical protein
MSAPLPNALRARFQRDSGTAEGFRGNRVLVGTRDPSARRGLALETGTPPWTWKACALSGVH